jgi:NADH-quinone oxidoreductase subunit H
MLDWFVAFLNYAYDLYSCFILWQYGLVLVKTVCLLIAIAYFTAAERKIMASIQRRRGPNVVGVWGLLQPLADGLKLIAKEMLIPTKTNSQIFVAAPILILTLSLISWSVIPFNLADLSEIVNSSKVTSTIEHLMINNITNVASHYAEWNEIANVRYSLLFILAISSLNVYGIIIAGWASNSKYSFLGSLRSAAQMISYEVSIGLVILPVILLSGSLNFTKIVFVQSQTVWFIFPLLPCAIVFFISMLAETNRAPFDLPEAEAELVAGYNVEYSSIIFAMFFLGEYCNMLLMSVLFVLFFMGGWHLPTMFFGLFLPSTFYFSSWFAPLVLSTKVLIICFAFVWVRATFPRYRYDQLMDIGWKVFLPLTLAFLVFVAGFLLMFNALPINLEVFPEGYSETSKYFAS